VRVALGTAQLGLPYGIANQTGQVGRSEAKAMLQLAATSGIDTLDTAIAYGESEMCLGEAGVKAFKVVTKLPAIPASGQDVGAWVREQVGSSLRRLGLPSVHGLLLHRSADLLGNDGPALWHAMEALRGEGLIRKIGVSVYAPSELAAVTNLYRIGLVQAPFNIIDRRLSTSGWLDRLKNDDVEIHTRSAFLQGLLLMPENSLPPKFLRWEQIFGQWHQWLSAADTSAVQACLSFALSYSQIDRVVVGADGMRQLQQIIDFSNRTAMADFPDLAVEDEPLIHPTLWRTL
jgi:aryl-alcohol dehydrogenase-like predicted oxidoreductase